MKKLIATLFLVAFMSASTLKANEMRRLPKTNNVTIVWVGGFPVPVLSAYPFPWL